MRKPLLATKSVTLVHCIRRGTGSTSYTTVLSGVSCREVAQPVPAHSPVQAPALPRKAAPRSAFFRAIPQQPRRAQQNRPQTRQAPFSTQQRSRPQTSPQGPVTGRLPRRIR